MCLIFKIYISKLLLFTQPSKEKAHLRVKSAVWRGWNGARVMEEKAKGSERWSAAIGNLSEMASNLESLQKLLLKKAVFVDDETFAKASLTSEQARTIKVCYISIDCFDIFLKFFNHSVLFYWIWSMGF